MICIFQLIALFTTFLFGSSLVVIGNYSQLNPKSCGFSRLSSQVDTNCFKWHKDITSPLKRGKNVGYGDAPWMVLLRFNQLYNNTITSFDCSGSVIANQWVLTAAHCLNGSFNFKIYMGYNFSRNNPSKDHYYESNETYIHPEYKGIYYKIYYKMIYDIGLVKMNKPINMSANENSICLPEKWSEVNEYKLEYVMLAGWGGRSRSLKMAPWLLRDYKYPEAHLNSKAMMIRVENQGVCGGDSGGPVWQYYMGRAVILGVYSVSGGNDGAGCDKDDQDSSKQINAACWVDTEIDWIKNVTQLN